MFFVLLSLSFFLFPVEEDFFPSSIECSPNRSVHQRLLMQMLEPNPIFSMLLPILVARPLAGGILPAARRCVLGKSPVSMGFIGFSQRQETNQFAFFQANRRRTWFNSSPTRIPDVVIPCLATSPSSRPAHQSGSSYIAVRLPG